MLWQEERECKMKEKLKSNRRSTTKNIKTLSALLCCILSADTFFCHIIVFLTSVNEFKGISNIE